MANLKACLAGFVANSRVDLKLFLWALYIPQLALIGEGCYYLISNNMLDNCCLMNADICMLIY